MDLKSCKVKKYQLQERGGGMDLMRVFGFFRIIEIYFLNKVKKNLTHGKSLKRL